MEFIYEEEQVENQKVGLRKKAQTSGDGYRRDERVRSYSSKRSSKERAISLRAHERRSAYENETAKILKENEEAFDEEYGLGR